MTEPPTQAATAAEPGIAGAQFADQGLRHHQAGRLDQARVLYLKALAAQPDNAAALHLLGVLCCQQGDPGEAVNLITRSVAINPNIAAWHANLGAAFAALGRLDEAAAAYRRAVALKPDHARAYGALAVILRDLGRFDEAAGCLRRAIAINPEIADPHNPLGLALTALGKLDEAVAAYRRTFGVNPTAADWHINIGLALAARGSASHAIAAYRRAIATNPDCAEAHGALGLVLLAQGDLRQGFAEYRWRWQCANFTEQAPARHYPLWAGERLSGKAILVYCEQGFGDSLQFIRYVKPLSGMARRVTVIAQAPLIRLFRSTAAGIEVTDAYQNAEYDYRIPLMDLPLLFGTALDSVPADIPYLAADPVKRAQWAARLARRRGSGLKVGLVWAGQSRTDNAEATAIDRRRSMTLEQLSPLADTGGDVQFFSLQKGEPSEQASRPPPAMALCDMAADLRDFDDTAALVSNLDLVISVDTAVVHLAGALGRPVWLLNRFDSCWRWLRGRDDSPWYPTLRQFRQPVPGDWRSAILRAQDALRRLAAGDRDQLRPRPAGR